MIIIKLDKVVKFIDLCESGVGILIQRLKIDECK